MIVFTHALLGYLASFICLCSIISSPGNRKKRLPLSVLHLLIEQFDGETITPVKENIIVLFVDLLDL